ncbi:MAG: hypothetical protein J6T18_11025 [Bacteroidaceae bacterium]|nr:hypothetical protein [Bacteroidaceae bacterium]
MKKIALYLSFAVVACIMACKGNEWETDEELEWLTESWARDYVSYTLNQAIISTDTTSKLDNKYRKTTITSTSVLSDTIYREFHFTKGNENKTDSVNVISALLQIRDSIIVNADGFRYSDKYWVHLYTIDPGIVNYEGKFHVDFYETGKTTPWGWSELTFRKDSGRYAPYFFENALIGWY